MERSIIVHTPGIHYEAEGGGIISDVYWGEVFPVVRNGGWAFVRFFCKETYFRNNPVRFDLITPNDEINKPLITVRRRRGGEGGFSIHGRPQFTIAYQVPVDELPEGIVEAYGLNTENRLAVERQLYQEVRERREEREQNAEHHRPIRGFAFLDTEDPT